MNDKRIYDINFRKCREYAAKKGWIPKVGGNMKEKRIYDIDRTKYGTVKDVLSVQFTVNYDDGTFGFLFKNDYGVTWVYEGEKI